MTVCDGAEEWRSVLRARGLSPITVAEYLMIFQQMVVWCDAQGRPSALTEVTSSDVGGFMEHLVATRSPATARARRIALMSFFRWTTNEGITKTDPTYRLARPALPESVVPVYTEGDVERLLGVCAGKDFLAVRDAAIIRFFATTGARRVEVAGLRVADVDFRTHSASLQCKRNRERVVPLTDTTVVALRRYLRARGRHRWAELDALWVGQSGELGPQAFAQMVHRRATTAGIDSADARRFRHTFAHEWKARGGSDEELLAASGWRDPRVLARYARVLD
jgi:site-specific recombinase XerD